MKTLLNIAATLPTAREQIPGGIGQFTREPMWRCPVTVGNYHVLDNQGIAIQ